MQFQSHYNRFLLSLEGTKNIYVSFCKNQTTELIYDGSNWNVNWFRESCLQDRQGCRERGP